MKLKGKIFNGKHYAFQNAHNKKAPAVSHAKRLRSVGNLARVVKTGKQYYVYAH